MALFPAFTLPSEQYWSSEDSVSRAGWCCSVPASVQEHYLHQNITEVLHSPYETAVFSSCSIFCSCSAALCQGTKKPPKNNKQKHPKNGFYRESCTQTPAFTLKGFCICLLSRDGREMKGTNMLLSEKASVVGPGAFMHVIMAE